MEKGEKEEITHFEESKSDIVSASYGKLEHKTIKELREDDKWKKGLVEIMSKGEHGTGADYGFCAGIKHMVFKEGIQFISDAFHLGSGNPILEKEKIIIELGGEPITHWNVTTKIPIISLITGNAITVGIGSCSTLESKYRFRGSERKCPECGKETIIKGKAEYGGGWLCYKKKDGCGAKFAENATAIIEQIVGRVENNNPIDVLDTVIAMSIKRARGRTTLDITGMSKYFRLPEDVEDEGSVYEGSQEYKDKCGVEKQAEEKKKENSNRKITKKDVDHFMEKVKGSEMFHVNGEFNEENFNVWLKVTTRKVELEGKGKEKTEKIIHPGKNNIGEITSIDQLHYLNGALEATIKELNQYES